MRFRFQLFSERVDSKKSNEILFMAKLKCFSLWLVYTKPTYFHHAQFIILERCDWDESYSSQEASTEFEITIQSVFLERSKSTLMKVCCDFTRWYYYLSYPHLQGKRKNNAHYQSSWKFSRNKPKSSDVQSNVIFADLRRRKIWDEVTKTVESAANIKDTSN